MHKQSVFTAWSADTLDKTWWWLREEPSAWSIEDGVLKLRSLPGTLWGTNNTARNMLFRPAIHVESGLTSEVNVTNHPQLQGEQAGLIWYNDEANYIKLVKECLAGTIWIVLAREENDEAVLVSKIPFTAESAQLRLTFSGQIIEGLAQATKDDPWEKVGECAIVNADVVHPGVFTHGGPEDEERWISLHNYHLYISGE